MPGKDHNKGKPTAISPECLKQSSQVQTGCGRDEAKPTINTGLIKKEAKNLINLQTIESLLSRKRVILRSLTIPTHTIST
jgi:hypothetical protein